ncbi:MAG: hypothetical protein HY730_06935 [Candidatus Tectomicrobia bacterium]|uniref:FimV N-terminal domain-containing protein n=1 Tax=Tectimicrobiota bacterium TaxID=2528274 RepID=A0A933LQE4_UNCTE|nr:hypothetical protein [Candidatus Tectomicrobia bacterium]
MQKWRICVVLSALVFVFTTIVSGISIGPINVKSHLGERFQAEIPIDLLREESPETLSVAIGSAQDFQLLQGQKSEVLTKLKTTVVPNNDGTKVLIQSNTPINQQSFDIVVRATLDQGTILKKYFISLPAQKTVSKSGDIQKDVITQKKPTTPNTGSNAYGPVNQGETLSHIARKLASPGQDVGALAVALWRTNRQVFVGENLHGLRYDTFLKLEELDKELASINPAQAHQIILSQWEEWTAAKSRITKENDFSKKSVTPKRIASEQASTSPDKLNRDNSKVTSPSVGAAAQIEQPKRQAGKEITEAKGVASSVSKAEQSDSPKRGEIKTTTLAASAISDTPVTKSSTKGKSPQIQQADVKSEQVSPAPEPAPPETIVGGVTENLEKTIASLKEQVAKIKKELQMFKARLFEMEGQNQNLRQYLTYLFYFTAGENILIIGLVVFFYIRKRRSGSKDTEVIDSDTLWVKK